MPMFLPPLCWLLHCAFRVQRLWQALRGSRHSQWSLCFGQVIGGRGLKVYPGGATMFTQVVLSDGCCCGGGACCRGGGGGARSALEEETRSASTASIRQKTQEEIGMQQRDREKQ